MKGIVIKAEPIVEKFIISEDFKLLNDFVKWFNGDANHGTMEDYVHNYLHSPEYKIFRGWVTFEKQ